MLLSLDWIPLSVASSPLPPLPLLYLKCLVMTTLRQSSIAVNKSLPPMAPAVFAFRKHLGARVTPMRWISTIYLASSTASWQAPAGTQVSRLASHVLNNPPSFVYPRCVRCAPLSYTCFVCSEWLAQTWLDITATTYNRQQWDDERCSWMTGCSNQSAPSSTLQRLSAWTNERHVFVCEQVSPLRMTYVLL